MTKKNRGVIAAGHPQTASAGQIMLELGGNAFDAAVAAAFTSCVVESTLTSLGGSGFFLAHTQNHQDFLFDFFSQTPLQKKDRDLIDFYPVDVNFGGEVQEFHIGLGSVAVPGMIAGLFAIQKKLGTLPIDLVVEPAINYARYGFEVTNFNEFCFRLLEPILLASPEGNRVYAPDGTLLKAQQRCYLTDFANSLAILAQKGSQAFYRGEMAQHLIENISQGSYLTFSDLENYQVVLRKPLKINYRNYEILTNPPPSSGGSLIAFALKLLEKIEFDSLNFFSTKHLKTLIKTMELTNEARQGSYDAYLHEEDIAEGFLSAENLANYVHKWGSTTHISVLDERGNAASITTTNGEGSSYIVPQLGIMLNNMLGEADINPLGFHNWACNQRISSMMSPTIILEAGQPKFVLGSGGANRIRTALLQVISNLVDFNFSIEQAISAPRIHWENAVLSLEPFAAREEIIAQLNPGDFSKINTWEKANMFFGGVHGVAKTVTGEMTGAGDFRREGAVKSFP